MNRLFLPLLFVCLATLTAGAQQQLPANQNIYGVGGRGIIYDQELNFSFGIATPRNLFVGIRSGRLISYDKLKFWSASIGTIRHSRERRENREDVLQNSNRISRGYTFGKINQLYAIRVGFGMRKYLSEKARQRGVALGYSYEFGPSLGLLKPYYLEYLTGETGPGNGLEDIRYSEEDEFRFTNQGGIFGASPWTVGLDEVRIRPGIHAKVAAHFGFGAFDEVSKSLEAGLMADFFLGNTDLMLESDRTPGISNPPLFLSLFLNVQFGKRW